MNKLILPILVLMLVLCVGLTGVTIRTLEEIPGSITLKIDFNDYEIEQSNEFTHIYLDDWFGNEISGSPELPLKRLNFIIPQDGWLSAEILAIDSYVDMIHNPVAPVPQIIKADETHRYNYFINDDLYDSDFSEFIEIEDPQHYRYYEYVPLTIKPVLLTNDKNLHICRSMTIQIDIGGDLRSNFQFRDQFSGIYSELFFNYDKGRNWQSRIENDVDRIPFERSDFWYQFDLLDQGLYRLSQAELSNLPDFYDPASLRVLTMDRVGDEDKPGGYRFALREIPLLIDQDSGEVFFSFQKSEEQFPVYAEYDRLWLTFGGDFPTQPLRTSNEFRDSEVGDVTGFTAFEPKTTRNSSRNVNCLFIHPQEFLTQTQELAQFHNDFYGLGTDLIDQQEIFNLYGGEPDPVMIKDYIYNYWQELPVEDSLKYVILMGSGTHDWIENTDKNRIMTWSDSDDNFVIFTANFAELIISRIPAQNVNDLELMIDRIKDYTENPQLDWWRNTMVILADDEHKDGGVEGYTSNSGLNHTNLAQVTQNAMNNGLYVDKVLGVEYNFDEYNNKPDARNVVIEKVNSGCLIWYFIGHGNPDVLGDEDYFRGSQHLRLLENGDLLTLFIAASCSVGEFDSPSFDCIAEKMLFLEDGGSIASLAASRECSGTANTSILKEFLRKIVNFKFNLGDALYYAKTTTSYVSTGKKYNLLGDAVMFVVPPEITGSFTNVPDSLMARGLVTINGDLELSEPFNGEGELRIYDSEYDVYYTNTINEHTYEVTYSRNGSSYYRGGVEFNGNQFEASFIVPDDIRFGEDGRFINYNIDELTKKDYLTYASSIYYSSTPAEAVSEDSPEVDLWLDSRSFLSGDYVSSSPILIAEIEDSNGINILGSAGHKILLLLDDEDEPIDVTEQFTYNTGSYTQGVLEWQITGLEEGNHYLRLIVFDNFNNPTVAETEFRVRQSGSVSIEQMLVYPNPIEKDGHFTFVLTEDSEVTVSLYTITGRKIKKLGKEICEAGYNQIYWDGKDGDGDRIANGTYFYKIKAKQLGNSEVTEKIGKLIILK